MHTRQNALNEWIEIQVNHQPFSLKPLAGDASFRRYFRLRFAEKTQIVMDAPPTHESIAPFIHVNNYLRQYGIHTPMVHAVDLQQGFALLDDLGDQLFLHAITADGQDGLYLTALDTLMQFQHGNQESIELPHFDAAHMLKEMALFHEWFLQAYLQLTLTAEEQQLLDSVYQFLIEQLQRQPQVFIHRDYHSRNLMLLNHEGQQKLGVIDFQDAMWGPITYDVVSLLKDCYFKLPQTAYQHYTNYFYQHQPQVQNWTPDDFQRQIDFCGLQRHLKILGIFCRLYLRDHKSGYLNDLPLALDYVNTCLQQKPEPVLQDLAQFLSQRVIPRFHEVKGQ